MKKKIYSFIPSENGLLHWMSPVQKTGYDMQWYCLSFSRGRVRYQLWNGGITTSCPTTATRGSRTGWRRGTSKEWHTWWNTPYSSNLPVSSTFCFIHIYIYFQFLKKNVDPSHCTCISLLQVITPTYYYKCYFVHVHVILTCYLSSPSLMGSHALLPSHNMDFLQ